jgi:hypothetical protein
MATMPETVSEVMEVSDNLKSVNYCSRPSKILGLDNKPLPCGGLIVVDTIERKDTGDYVVKSHCGKCNATEEDTFKAPSIKHSERCIQSQKRGEKPFVYLQSVNYPIYAQDPKDPKKQIIIDYGIVWKCAGSQYPKESGNETTCDAIEIIKRGGFPF